MEGDPPVVADSAPEVQAAPPAAAEPQGVTHGDQTEQASTDDPTPAESDSQPTGDEEDDPDLQVSESDTEEEAKTEAQKRRERRIRREQERIEQQVAERLAAKEREQQETTAREKREAEARAARERAAKEFAEYIGEEGESDRLAAENAELYDRLRVEIGTLTQDEFDEIDKKIAANKSRLADIQKARGFQEKIGAQIWNGIEAHVYSPLQWPEFADPATKQRYLGADGGIAGALTVLKDVIRSAAIAEKDAEIETLKKSHASEVSTLREEMRGWRVRAGAEEVPDTTSGGQAATSASVYTRERLRQMMQTPEGIAEYRRNRAEIERQELAGLIR